MPRNPNTPGSYRGDLKDHIAMLPTPNAHDGHIGYQDRSQKKGQENVETVVRNALLPTPRAGNPGSRPNEKGGKILSAEVGKPTGLKLQPSFVEWMMGLPLGWTDLSQPNRE
jgi:hypothetical protein